MFTLETIGIGCGTTLAIAVDGGHLPLAAASSRFGVHLPDASLFDHLQAWDARWPSIAEIGARAGSLSELVVRDASVVPQLGSAGKVLCAGANYYKHLAEMDVRFEKDEAKAPFFFLKPPAALVGPGRSVPLDPSIKMLDWEVELAAVIGRRGRDIARSEALAHVAGYTVAVDVTARDRLFQPDSIFKFDFFAGKGQDGFCPTANGFVPAALLGDPQSARLRLAVNGVMKQDASTSDMIYSVAELVSWASRITTLEPGDVLLTGSPEGVGFSRREFLKPGDVMRVELAPHLACDIEVFQKEPKGGVA